jgi:hypothetical protein
MSKYSTNPRPLGKNKSFNYVYQPFLPAYFTLSFITGRIFFSLIKKGAEKPQHQSKS